MRYFLFLVFLSFAFAGNTQSIVGQWKTIDDNTGKPRSVVEIYEQDGKYFGKVLKLFREPGEDPDPICDECSGDKKNAKIIGMEIITNMKYDAADKEYDSGEILDPESGSVYDCKLWIGEDKNLKVRGYLLFFYRTQIWLPYEG